MDLNNIKLEDISAKLKTVDKKTLIKFGIGFGAILIFLIGYYVILNPIVKNKKALYEDIILKQDEIVQFENEIISGFDEDENIQNTGEKKATIGKEDWNTFYGYAGISLSYSFVKEPPEDNSNSDWSGFTKIRPFFSLTWDTKLGDKWKSRIVA